MHTKVTNQTGADLIVKEGTAGILRTLKILPNGKSYDIKVDANATYREYWCAEKNDDLKAVVLSSDDCQEYKTVTIMFKSVANSSETYSWEGVRRDGQEGGADVLVPVTRVSTTTEESGVVPPGNPVTSAQRKPGFLSWITGPFKKSGN